MTRKMAVVPYEQYLGLKEKLKQTTHGANNSTVNIKRTQSYDIR